MRWRPGRRSRNLEDRRGESVARRRGFPLPLGRARVSGRPQRLSLASVVVLVVLFVCFRDEMLQVLGDAGAGVQVPTPPGTGAAGEAAPPTRTSPEEERLVDFVSFVLDDLQATWARTLPGYRDARLVLFRDAVVSGCGQASAQVGPFYCPADAKVYVDLGFFEDLHERFGAPGDFAQAYVLAHEIGHHVQHLLGVDDEVRRLGASRPQLSRELSVRVELQADCLAGVWGAGAAERGLLEPGDAQEGLAAAAAIGDDRLQRMARDRVAPESFTHGSSAQRERWLRQGLETGDVQACDTFGVEDP